MFKRWNLQNNISTSFSRLLDFKSRLPVHLLGLHILSSLLHFMMDLPLELTDRYRDLPGEDLGGIFKVEILTKGRRFTGPTTSTALVGFLYSSFSRVLDIQCIGPRFNSRYRWIFLSFFLLIHLVPWLYLIRQLLINKSWWRRLCMGGMR